MNNTQGILTQVTAVLGIITFVGLIVYNALLSKLSRIFTAKDRGEDHETRIRALEWRTRHLDTKTKA